MKNSKFFEKFQKYSREIKMISFWSIIFCQPKKVLNGLPIIERPNYQSLNSRPMFGEYGKRRNASAVSSTVHFETYSWIKDRLTSHYFILVFECKRK